MCVNCDRKKLFYALCICRGLNVIAKSYYVNCYELCVYCGSYGLKVIIKTWNVRIHIALRVVYMYIYCGLKVITNLKYSYTYVHITVCHALCIYCGLKVLTKTFIHKHYALNYHSCE